MNDIVLNNEGINIRKKIWEILRNIDLNILEKFKNLNGKTGKYDVPDELFQKRTHRSNRVLLRWKIIHQNNMTLPHLRTFFGGVCVEFVNEDFYNLEYKENQTYKFLISKIGSDEKISSIVTFRNEDGDSGATIARESYNRFISEPNDHYFPIRRKLGVEYKGKGDNSVWEGNLYYSIKGGSQISHESHANNKNTLLFNPAVEYANELVCLDIEIMMSYFALHCYDIERNKLPSINNLIIQIENYLNMRIYDEGNLLDYCKNHFSLKCEKGILVDPIQMTKMSIEDFKTSGLENSAVVCHNEAANKNKFYFDSINKFILSPARPTNLFWAKHKSNMMQQNSNLDEYFKEEEMRANRRKMHY